MLAYNFIEKINYIISTDLCASSDYILNFINTDHEYVGNKRKHKIIVAWQLSSELDPIAFFFSGKR